MDNSKNKFLGVELDPSILDKANPSPRVLVVDDDWEVRELIAGHLSKADYRVDTAQDGAEAWKALNGASYHLLVTDHMMPKVTGLELIKKLRSNEMTLPVILVSGTIPTEELKLNPTLRIEGILSKPFDIPELLDTVKRVLSPVSQPPFADLSEKPETALPATRIAQAPEPAIAPRQERIDPSHRILIVDDDPKLRQLSMDLLTAANYYVEGVKDGAAGWEALQANGNYDLIITDNQMPRMTGVEFIEKLRSARLTHRVMMATGNLPTHEFARRPWLKPDATLQRPFTNENLLEAVRNVLLTEKGGPWQTAPESPINPV